MKRLISLILMMTALAVPAAAQMNYELPSAHITYTHLGESAMPALIDVLGDGTAQQAEEPQADTWPKTFTVTVAGDTRFDRVVQVAEDSRPRARAGSSPASRSCSPATT